jgi:hypothetical protein
MPIAAVDNRTITYHTGGAPASANSNQTASDVSAYIATQAGASANTTTQAGTGLFANITTQTGTLSGNITAQAGTGSSANITEQGASGGWVDINLAISGGWVDIANLPVSGGWVDITNLPVSGAWVDITNLPLSGGFSQLAFAALSVSGSPSVWADVPVQSAADDPPKAISNDDLSRALSAARTRGRALVSELLRGKDMLTTEEFGKLIGVTRDILNEKRKRQEILALEGAGRGKPRFPKWQIGKDGKPFRALPQLFDRLGGNPWTVYRFLVQHHPELNGLTGVEALQRGRTNRVLDAAESTLTAAS